MKHLKSLVVMPDVDVCLCLLSGSELCLLALVSEPEPCDGFTRPGVPIRGLGVRERESGPGRSANSYLDTITPSPHQPAQKYQRKLIRYEDFQNEKVIV